MGNQMKSKTLNSKTHHECQKGPTIQIAVPKGKSVNAKFYKGKTIHKLKKYFKNRRPATGIRGVRLLHDNISSNKAAIVNTKNVVELPHPSCSPELAPCDFFLFPRLKKTHRWKKISNA
jgi:histone-lysine N-methyltransferase SETMAR